MELDPANFTLVNVLAFADEVASHVEGETADRFRDNLSKACVVACCEIFAPDIADDLDLPFLPSDFSKSKQA